MHACDYCKVLHLFPLLPLAKMIHAVFIQNGHYMKVKVDMAERPIVLTLDCLPTV